MAYKYKLVKEIESDVLKRIGQFIKSVTIQPGDIPLEAIRKIFTQIPANNDETETLDFGIRDLLLNDGNFSEDEVEEYMDFLYQERKGSVTSGGVPINEKEEGYYKDPETGKNKQGSLQTSLNARLQQFKDEDKKEQERKEREEQGKAKLTQEVLRRLRNR